MKSLKTLLFFLLTLQLSAQTTADFENFNLTAGTYLNDAGASGKFESGHVLLPNDYNPDFDAWSGWAISATVDNTTPGYLNQYSAITGGGADGSKTYAVAYAYAGVVLQLSEEAVGGVVSRLDLTNSTYAYLSMLEGDAFSKKFGGESGDDPDFFKLTIKKYLNGQLGTDSIDFYLADYRFANNSQDYIVDSWTSLNLAPLGNADSLLFTLTSTDVGIFGINTPTYFCVDNVTTSDMPSPTAEVGQAPQVAVFPNPATDFLQISLPGEHVATACISDVYGKILVQRKIAPGVGKIDVLEIPAGAFSLQIRSGDQLFSQIFIKK